MSGNCGFMVTSSFGCCFVLLFLVRGRCLNTSMTGMSLRQKQEGTMQPKGDGIAAKGCWRGLAVMAHSFSAILLSFSCPFHKFISKEGDPVKCEWTAGGSQLWLHAGWELYTDSKLYMLLITILQPLNSGVKVTDILSIHMITCSHSPTGSDGSISP